MIYFNTKKKNINRRYRFRRLSTFQWRQSIYTPCDSYNHIEGFFISRIREFLLLLDNI